MLPWPKHYERKIDNSLECPSQLRCCHDHLQVEQYNVVQCAASYCYPLIKANLYLPILIKLDMTVFVKVECIGLGSSNRVAAEALSDTSQKMLPMFNTRQTRQHVDSASAHWATELLCTAHLTCLNLYFFFLIKPTKWPKPALCLSNRQCLLLSSMCSMKNQSQI